MKIKQLAYISNHLSQNSYLIEGERTFTTKLNKIMQRKETLTK